MAAGDQLRGPDGKPIFIMKNGQRVPALSIGTDADRGFIGIDDILKLLAGPQQPDAGLLGEAIAPSKPFVPVNPMASEAGDSAMPQPTAWPQTAVPSFGTLNPQAPAAPATPTPPSDDVFSGATPGYYLPRFPRGPQQTGLENTLAGAYNSVIDANNSVIDLGINGWNYLFTPEGQAKAQAAEAPAGPGFKPALPSTTAKITNAESGGSATAKNPNSSAYGPGQFIKSTWLQFMREAHPEMLDYMTKDEVLELRSDPALSEEGTQWYAGKAIDALDDIDAPATDTNIYLHHFLGPEGMKAVLSADPDEPVSKFLPPEVIAANKSILGGTTTAQDVIDWASVKMGDMASLPGNSKPPVPRPFASGPAPRPDLPLPDFTAANDWLEKAAPKPIDEQALKNAQFADLLAGIGSGLGSLGSYYGGDDLFAALGAGTSAGVQKGQDLALQFQQQLAEDQRQYAGVRANAAVAQEAATRGVQGQNLEIDWNNKNDVIETQNKNADTAWLNANDQRDYETLKKQELSQRLASEKLASTPKILDSSSKGIIVQNPDGNISVISLDATAPLDEAEKLGKAFGQDSSLFRNMKYTTMIQQGSGLLQVQAEIAKDIVNDGLGGSVFGDNYAKALEIAEKQVPGGLTADPKLQQQEVMKALVGLLLEDSQQTGNYDWILNAAKLGNPGALLLVQGSQSTQ